jgi:hypothetical protein
MLQDMMGRIGRTAVIGGVVGLVVGCLLGWLVLGWLLFPVQWTNADPWDLRPEQKEAYVLLVAESYGANPDAQLAQQRMAGFDKGELNDMLAKLIEENEQAGKSDTKRQLQYLATALELSPSVSTPISEPAATSPTSGLISSVRSLVPICGLALLLLVIVALIAVIVFRVLQRRAAAGPAKVPKERPADLEGAPETMLGRFRTSYAFGDDGYDTSFNIETHGAEGEFLGACGIGFSEVLGEGSPDKIAAFEVWIFDKTDMDNVQTVTKVLMSEFAFHSEVLREKMKDRGEAVLAQPGQMIVIGAVGLQLSAEIMDFQYGDDPSLPPNSYFQSLTAQLVPAIRS